MNSFSMIGKKVIANRSTLDGFIIRDTVYTITGTTLITTGGSTTTWYEIDGGHQQKEYPAQYFDLPQLVQTGPSMIVRRVVPGLMDLPDDPKIHSLNIHFKTIYGKPHYIGSLPPRVDIPITKAKPAICACGIDRRRCDYHKD